MKHDLNNATKCILLISIVFFGFGCTTQQATNSNVQNTTNTVATNEATNTSDIEVSINNNSNSTMINNETEVDRSDWETHSNEEYGFSFQYPKEWILTNNNSVSYSDNTYSIAGISTGGHYPSLSIVIKKLPMTDVVQEIYEFDSELSPVTTDETITINNTSVRHIVKSGFDYPISIHLIELKDNTILMFDGISTYDKIAYSLVVD